MGRLNSYFYADMTSSMKGQLFHKTPSWVPTGAKFHIRICTADKRNDLIKPEAAKAVLDAADFYHVRERWYLHIMLLMPDHLHAVISFPQEPGMSRTISAWKAYTAKCSGIRWQRNYFDHRLRNDDEWVEKMSYLRMNPVRAGLCDKTSEWLWVLEHRF